VYRRRVALPAPGVASLADNMFLPETLATRWDLGADLGAHPSAAAGMAAPAVGTRSPVQRGQHRQPVGEDQRHLFVDTLGLPIACYVTPASVSDPQGARRLLAGRAFFLPCLKKIWADAAYRGKELADWCRQQGDG
jgi:DDE family transposase